MCVCVTESGHVYDCMGQGMCVSMSQRMCVSGCVCVCVCVSE